MEFEKTLQFLSIFRPLSYVDIGIIGVSAWKNASVWVILKASPRQK